MRSIYLAAVAIALGGCAASPELPVASSSAGLRAGFVQQGSSEPIKVAAVVELEPASRDPNVDREGVVCRDTYMTGSRIRRTQCEAPPTEAQQNMERERLLWDLEYAREMAAIERQNEIQERTEERLRRADMRP